MLYIHTLKDLNPKSAEIESVPLVREIKQANSIPLQENKIQSQLSQFFISKEDVQSMYNALGLIHKALKDLGELSKMNGDFELINFQRTHSMIDEIPEALKQSLDYALDMLQWQETFAKEITALLNEASKLKTKEDKQKYNEKISAVFEKILRNKSFRFNFSNIVNEAHISRANTLEKGMSEGFLFHVNLEEYLGKQDFAAISKKIPAEQLEKAEQVKEKILGIKKGVEAAYAHNMKMINMSIVLYSFMKWLKVF